MARVSADGLMPAALALRAKCRFSAKCRKRLSSCCVAEAMLRLAQFRLPIIGANATLAQRRGRSILRAGGARGTRTAIESKHVPTELFQHPHDGAEARA